ncbi:AMP-binding protein [Rhodococcus sp. CSLK01-03]|uniref:AMP-binding protein n=1 Tax=Rhodococcus indonesiensis TaxID=3055869 RepID=A0ABT7RVL9_9NOCA|nr:AMP-binding protein [Rhodococcus indonesiensis]MDM7491700.1 AMP-binding protein [Rhodococcus indonesiensis]
MTCKQDSTLAPVGAEDPSPATCRIPSSFNLGVACLDDQDCRATALTVVHIHGGTVDFTFGQVRRCADRLAASLVERGVGRGDVVATVDLPSVTTALVHMAALRVGAIGLPIPEMPESETLRFYLTDSAARLVLTSGEHAPRVCAAVSGSRATVVVPDPAAVTIGYGPSAPAYRGGIDFHPVRTSSADPAILVYGTDRSGRTTVTRYDHRVVLERSRRSRTESGGRSAVPPRSLDDRRKTMAFMEIIVSRWFRGLPVVATEGMVSDRPRSQRIQ